jgi:tRNA A-37 threonylcarbamoyl transferase component Bud32
VPGITVLDSLAYGGFAVVYRARQESVGREVALKVDNRLAHDDRDRRRFLREAHAAGRLSDHPNVISIYDAGITPDGHPYLVMELCPGGSLAQRIKRDGPMGAAEARDIGVKIADALQCAHDAGVLHRDVKPANVLVNRFGSPGLADFGMAASFEGAQQMSATLEALTPAFAPPEVFRHEPPTPAVDVYGLAATLYCLLSGRPPRWPAEGHPSIATIIGLQEEPVMEIPGVPAALTAILRKALSADPADRHSSAAALGEALQGAALDVPTGMFGVIPAAVDRSHRSVESADAAALHESSEPSSGRAARRRGGRHMASVGSGSLAEPAGTAVLAPPRGPGGGRREERPEAEELNVPRPRAESRRPEGTGTITLPPRRPANRRVRRVALASIGVAAVLGVVAAVAVNSRDRTRDLTANVPISGGVLPSAVATQAAQPGASPAAAASPSVAVPTPSAQLPPPRVRGADPEVITGAGLGPFRIGEPAQPLLLSKLARHPDSNDPCPAAAQLLATDARYQEQFQTLSAHTVAGRITHVTIFSEKHRARSGLHIGSSILEISTAAPQAQQFGSIAPSFLVRDGELALLFVVRNGVVMAIMTGAQGELSSVAEVLGRNPTDLAPLC